MNELSRLKCVACRGGDPQITEGEIAALNPQVPDWQIIEVHDVKRLQRVFKLKDYSPAVELTNKIAANSIVAVTATKLYALEVKGGFSFKIKAPIGSWDRSAVVLDAQDGKATVAMKFDFGPEGVAVLETRKLAANAGNLNFVREVMGDRFG